MLLSSHTGGFEGIYRQDLTAQMDQILDAWQTLPLHFDAIHIGYLAGPEQLAPVHRLIERYRAHDTLLFVDPAMGDWGKRYNGLSEELEAGFRALCAQADVIFPNRTEAALLLDTPYTKGSDSPAALLAQLRGLLAQGAKAAVITGISGGDGHIGAVCMQADMASPQAALTPRAQGNWPGTGDLFAAACEAALLLGHSLPDACRHASQFLYDSVRDAPVHHSESRFGAPFEGALPALMRSLGKL